MKRPLLDEYRGKRSEAGASNATINREVTFLSGVFKLAVIDGTMEANPCYGFQKLPLNMLDLPKGKITFRPSTTKGRRGKKKGRTIESPPSLKGIFEAQVTEARKAGEETIMVSRYVGHSSLAMIDTRYAHVRPKRLKGTADRGIESHDSDTDEEDDD